MNTELAQAPNLDRNEMAFRQIYAHLLSSQQLTTVIRPGRRTGTDWRGYDPGDIVTARIIKNVGADWAHIAPEFLDEAYQICIEEVQKLHLREITQKHFRGMSHDIHDKQSLIYHLGTIYNLPIEVFSDESEITRISFSYTNQSK